MRHVTVVYHWEGNFRSKLIGFALQQEPWYTHCGERVEAVSYTHLDVYKRQVIFG